MAADGRNNSENPDKPSRVSSVLFVCSMNCIRSPMAEQLAKDMFPGQLFVESAGAVTGEPDGFAISVMAERGIDISGHVPKTLEELEDDYFDLIVTLSPQAHHKVMDFVSGSSVDVEYWPTMDPTTVAGSREQVLDAYREVRDWLEGRIRERFG